MAVKKGKQGSGDAYARAAAKARKRWDESKKKKDGFTQGLEYEELEDGDYPAKLVKAVTGVTKKGDGDIYLSLDFVLLGDNEGKEINIFFDLSKESKADQMARALKRLDYEIGELDPEDIKGITNDLNKSVPYVLLQVANKDKDKDDKPLDEPRCYVNIQKTIDPATLNGPSKKAGKGKKAKK